MSFERLSPALQYQIVHTLHFRELRRVQEVTTAAVLDGDNCVVLAPTAGGKTEAAFFPLLSLMDTEDWKPVSVIYLSPIRALLNNQEGRLERLAGLIGRRVFKWHGDVAGSQKQRFLRDPADILLSTPESVEAMLMSPRVAADTLFAGLRAVVVDEVHNFADDDRGAHLSSVLQRLVTYGKRDVQRLGLSATVGNPEEILSWLQGSSRRAGRVVHPGGASAEPAIAIDYVGDEENAARVIASLHHGKKRLVFVEARRQAEAIGRMLSDHGVDTWVLHGSLSAKERREAERAFEQGHSCVIVATSAMELGIDIGDLHHVLQVGAPSTVASFLQRMGRTGRRAGAVANCTFLALKEDDVLRAATLVQLRREGWVEPVRPNPRASHILAHQVMALGIQLSGVVRRDIPGWLGGAAAFSGLERSEWQALIDQMLSEEILADQGGRLWLGPKGEKLYGRANFRRLYAVFEAPRAITVRAGPDELGTVEAKFLLAIHSESDPGSFILGGKSWEVITVDWERGICVVRPSSGGRPPRWGGWGRHLSYDICQAMLRLLTTDDEDPSWSKRTKVVMKTLRAQFEFLRDEGSSLRESGDTVTWWTFAGGAANTLLAKVLEHRLGERCTARNERIELSGDAARSMVAVRDVIRELAAEGRPNELDARAFAGTDSGAISKFAPCLPEDLLRDLVAWVTLDWVGARKAVQCAAGVA